MDVGLRDGSTVHVRPVAPTDAAAVTALFDRLSPESVHSRFHGARHLSSAEIRTVVEVDYVEHLGLVAVLGRGAEARIVALASYVKTGDGRAEIGIVVDDSFHGKGIGSILIEHLGEAAAANAIHTFEAEVLGSNTAMLEVVGGLELPLDSKASAGVVHVEFPTTFTRGAVAAFEAREAIAAAAGVRAFLSPSSVAVIGASRRRGTIGGELFRNLLDLEFQGPVYPVNPTTSVVQSVIAYPSILDVPGPVDMAVIVVPAPAVLDVARDCGAKGVRGLLIISSGFAEVGDEGRARQDELVEVARSFGMRIIGPNCMGALNTSSEVRLNATFAPGTPPPGTVAFSSQSGALGIAVMERARELGLGLSTFVSVGNKADISGNDLLQYWEQDPDTDVILLYLESFGNPRKFARIARRVSRTKPIVAVKSGRSAAGARAAASHTGSMAAGDVAVDALFRQAGVIRTNTLEELFDVASLLSTQPLPAGPNVGILTNAGGLGILCADACEAAGLSIASLADETTTALRHLLPAEASVGNPVDMIASASAEHYERSLRMLLDDPGVDSVIAIFIPPLVTRSEDVADALMRVAEERSDKTIVACFLGVQGVHERLRSSRVAIPSHTFPESAGRALARVTDYGRWCRRDEGSVPDFPVERGEGLALVARALDRGADWLTPDEVSALLGHYGIPFVRGRTVATTAEVEVAAADIGGPVVVKIVSSKLLHKTDVGGVRVDLRTPEEARAAAEEMARRVETLGDPDALEGFLVQPMISDVGAEMFVGVTFDPSFGPLVACGAGGTLVELTRDVAVRITPLTDTDVHEMVRSLRTLPLLEGYRGAPRLDVAALEDILLRIGVLVEHLPHVAEVDLNPVMVMEDGKGCIVVDARIRVAAPAPEVPRGARSAR